MDEYLFKLVIGLLFIFLGAVGTMVVIYWRSQAAWMNKMDDRQDKQGELLIRIDEKVNNYEELKRKQEHDHAAIRDLDRLVNNCINQVQKLEEQQTEMKLLYNPSGG